MDIHERIHYVMQQENLTAKDFSDILGVQRSSISHLVSGRNKPSIDFLEKFIEKFPKYNPVWFITGKGDMNIAKEYVDNQLKKEDSTVKSGNRIVQHSLFEVPPLQEKPTETIQDSNESPKPLPEPVYNHHHETQTASQDEVIQPKNQDIVKREIERVVFFFSDGTFETYTEKKKNG
jgi:transcriptional regulator with XRE-family HTH domain